ncbi:WRT-10 protein, partial [Aphelenchoides avenae]
VVNKITVYEDGAIEAECGPIPCGSSGESCSDDQAACRADVNVFSGMKWAKNGQ